MNIICQSFYYQYILDRFHLLKSPDIQSNNNNNIVLYTLYHIFKQESIQCRGTIKGRGMIKGRHLALYQVFKTTVFTTKYMINSNKF